MTGPRDGDGSDDEPYTVEDVRWPSPQEWSSDVAPPDPRTARTSPGRPSGGDGPHAVPWSWADGLALIAWWLVASTIVGTAAILAGVDIFEDRTAFLAVGALAQVVTFVGALVWLAVRGALTRELVGETSSALRYAGWGLAVGVGGWFGMTFVMVGVVAALGIEELPTQETIEILAAGDLPAVIIGVVLAIVLAPVVEELIYRGVLFQGLRASIGVWPAIVLSGAIFGFVHLETVLQDGRFVATGLIPMAGIALVGAFWAWALHRTGSLIVPIVGHAAFNAIAVTLAFLTMREDGTPIASVLSPVVRALTGL